jgi:hypothetical protein
MVEMARISSWRASARLAAQVANGQATQGLMAASSVALASTFLTPHLAFARPGLPKVLFMRGGGPTACFLHEAHIVIAERTGQILAKFGDLNYCGMSGDQLLPTRSRIGVNGREMRP